MPGLFDKSEIELTCPKCKRKFKASLSEMKRRPKFPCPKCGQGFDATQFGREMKNVEKELDDLGKGFGDIKIDF